jgi:hypothetical protein
LRPQQAGRARRAPARAAKEPAASLIVTIRFDDVKALAVLPGEPIRDYLQRRVRELRHRIEATRVEWLRLERLRFPKPSSPEHSGALARNQHAARLLRAASFLVSRWLNAALRLRQHFDSIQNGPLDLDFAVGNFLIAKSIPAIPPEHWEFEEMLRRLYRPKASRLALIALYLINVSWLSASAASRSGP